MELSLPNMDKIHFNNEEYDIRHDQDLFPPVEQKIIKWLMEAGIEMKDPSECVRDYYSRKKVRSKTNTFCLQLGENSPLFMKRKSPAENSSTNRMVDHTNFSAATTEISETGLNKKQSSSDALSPSWSLKVSKIEEHHY